MTTKSITGLAARGRKARMEERKSCFTAAGPVTRNGSHPEQPLRFAIPTFVFCVPFRGSFHFGISAFRIPHSAFP